MAIASLRSQLNTIIFGTHTKAGKRFDIVLLWLIVLSVVVVMLESVEHINYDYEQLFNVVEWVLTIFFTFEYLARLWIAPKPRKYIFSFYGIIDLLAILPSYLVLIWAGGGFMIIIRAIRLLRVFKVLSLSQYMNEASSLGDALFRSRRKIIVFMGTVVILVFITGTIMYVIEGGKNGFTSIPRSVYWAVVTVTTVGYGDISPVSTVGQFFATLLMLLGYAIIAVPTGIVTSELTRIEKIKSNSLSCSNCGEEAHRDEARWCALCGEKLRVK